MSTNRTPQIAQEERRPGRARACDARHRRHRGTALLVAATVILAAAAGIADAGTDDDVKWLRNRAEQGDAHSQWDLGEAYEMGALGVAQDYAEAVKWYRRAADQGLASAQYSLGLMYEHGRGVPKDYVQAHKWFNLASAAAHDSDNPSGYWLFRDRLAEQMTPEQIAKAQKLAREWKPSGGK